MFPQSELDNYKLQVELLQEKLQRSEISRQQLEQKLDKILQKRDEHEKIIRSKARQKYQQFLEEQQRRNERNKQLVQMLERIEQQTEVLNARSERLKMMKLQYEMYFAKLVHTQTRRCIQNSVQPMTHFMPTSTAQPVWPPVQQFTMQDHHYGLNAEATTPLGTNNSYQYCTPTRQENNMPMNTSDIPTLTQFVRKEESNMNMASAVLTPSQCMYQNIIEAHKNMADVSPYIANNNQEIPDSITNNKLNANVTDPSAANLLANDKKLSESNNEHYNVTTTPTSSKFEAAPNLAMMPQNVAHTLYEPPKPARVLEFNKEVSTNKNANFQTLNHEQVIVPLKSTNEKQKNAEETKNETQSPNTIELKNNESNQPIQLQKVLSSMQSENSNGAIESSVASSKTKNYLKKQITSLEQTEQSEFLINKAETNSSITPVSIENIENQIYGELLLPLNNEENESEVPKLLENLVTQSAENIENISKAAAQAKEEITAVKEIEEHTTNIATVNENEQNQNLYNYEQNTTTNDEFNNPQQTEETAQNFADYSNYENVASGGEMDESQQQYDYSNYDPTQYSYPGYVYDETTGEYKPDPNAPLEQYATDQQYAAEGYEQQYQQQDYDYNQTYAEDTSGLVTTNENSDNNEYESMPKKSSDISPTEENVIQQPEPNPSTAPPQTILATEETSTSSATPKVIKPTSILSTADKSEAQKKKKRVNFIDSSETDESAAAPAPAGKGATSTSKPVEGNLPASNESDFDFSSSTEAEAKST